MKKIFVLLLTIALVVIMVGAAFTAAFSDVEQSSDNTLTAGTLDLKINDKDDATAAIEHMDFANLKPGDNRSQCWNVKNGGSIAGQLWFEVSGVKNSEVNLLEMERAAGDTTEFDGELGSQMLGTWKFKRQGDIDYTPWQPRYIDNMPGIAYGKPGSDVIVLPVLDQNEFVDICLDTEFVEGSNNNLAQNDSLEFDVVFTLNQSATGQVSP
jgi:predicted ribosomally synthesized peptide with SipW-like signal peptide